MVLVNGKERTILEMQDVMKRAGWQMDQVHHSGAGTISTQKVVGIPV